MQGRVPKPIAGVNLVNLPLTAVEAFVLSRIDGATTLDDLSTLSGIDSDTLAAILNRLEGYGVVQLPWRSGVRDVPPHKALRHRGVASIGTEDPFAPDAHFRAHPPRFTLAELEEPADIPVEIRRRILHAFHALADRNLYQVLGVTKDADRAEIRRAYFELSKLFHTDAYFGKNLGNFRPKMEAIFKQLTECYEVLGRPKRRREYDEYLEVSARAQRAQRTMQSLEFTAQEIAALRNAAERRAADERGERPPSARPHDAARPSPAARLSARPGDAVRPSPAAARLSTGPDEAARPSSVSAQSSPAAASGPLSSPAERRKRASQRLKRHLRPLSTRSVAEGESRVPSGPSVVAAPTGDEAVRRRRESIESLRNALRDSNSFKAVGAGIDSFMAKAKQAETSGDVLLAVSQIQLALAADPSNAQAISEYARLNKLVARELAANHEKQAQYEEKSGKWEAAARSWIRVSEARCDDMQAARKAADALLKAGGDLHQAQKYAQRAVDLDRNHVPNLTTLARVFLAAGLKLNARRELEKAAKLAPTDEAVLNLTREAQ